MDQQKSQKCEAIVRQAQVNWRSKPLSNLDADLNPNWRLMNIIKGMVFVNDQFGMVPCILVCHESH